MTFMPSPVASKGTKALAQTSLRPVTSLMSAKGLRPVCREWRNIIDDPGFAEVHATSGIGGPRILLLLRPPLRRLAGWMDPRFAAPFIMSDELLVTSLPEPVASSWLYGEGVSCHGLLCFDDRRDGGATHLLNPLTREIASVAGPSVAPRKRGHRQHKHQAIRGTRAEVLDQGSRSWRDIASVPPRLFLGVPVYAAGSFHFNFVGSGADNRVKKILSFDLAKEEFAPTPCPEFQNAHLIVLRGKLGLVDLSQNESIDVWVMEEEGGGRWAKEYSIPLRVPRVLNTSNRSVEFLGCGGQKIMLRFKGSILSYDPATGKVKYAQRGGASLARAMGSITVSLLSPAKLWNMDKVVLPLTAVMKMGKGGLSLGEEET
ncbi:putative F-box protein At4g38870 [Eucalyptus grandis]|uniref:putative F-box protein At4g38870 n=1 Tax=Eucalyptus grandis TaxID=71139 RepID=UPI00192EFD57|nr:putative F-box protein At4g38870 [Eucalyptus grandis]